MIGLPRGLAQRPCIFRRLSPSTSPAKRVRPSGAKQLSIWRCPALIGSVFELPPNVSRLGRSQRSRPRPVAGSFDPPPHIHVHLPGRK